MDEEIDEFIAGMSTEFVNGDVDLLYNRMARPMAIYIGDQMVLISGKEDFVGVLHLYLGGLSRAGLVKTIPKLESTTRSTADTVIALTTSRHLGRDDRLIGTSEVRYFLRRVCGGLKIEMIEYVKLPVNIHGLEKPHLAVVTG